MGCQGKSLKMIMLSLGTSPPLTEVSQALRARNAKKVWKMSSGASGPGTPRSLQKVLGTVWEVYGESPKVSKESSGLFPRLFGDFSGFRGRRPGETFSRLCRNFGPEGLSEPTVPLDKALFCYRGHFGPLGPKVEKRSKDDFRGLSALGVRKGIDKKVVVF